jgi:hypothetical protein
VPTTGEATTTTTVPGTARYGYWLVTAAGGVEAFGPPSFGDLSQVKLPSAIAGGAVAPGSRGYWLVSRRGGVYTFGDARFWGSAGSLKLRKPIVAMASTPDGGGYWLVASDGGIFAYGDARFYGSMGGKHLNKPIVGIAPTPDGGGYWLVASDGGIFAYGDARFYGSTGKVRLNKPIVAMASTPDGGGYWLVASDGGIFAYGDANFLGSAGGEKLVTAVAAMAVTPDGKGYWLAEQDGNVIAFGDAPRPPGSRRGSSPVVAILAATYTSAAPPTTTTTTTRPPTTTTRPRVTTTTRPRVTTTTRPRVTTTTRPRVTTTTRPRVTTTVPKTTTTTTPGTSPSHPYAPGATGYDVSWPQCTPMGSARVRPLPPDPSFAIVGINDGYMSGFNSCFAAEAAWAGRNRSVYIILQPLSPGSPEALQGPKAACALSSGTCQGYDWGYNYTKADIAFIRARGLGPKIWWLDIETAEGWSSSKTAQAVNAQVIQGSLDAVRSSGDVGGIYSTWYQWGAITGSYVPPGGVPIWIPGANTVSGNSFSAKAFCQRALQPGDPSKLSSTYMGFAGGAPWLVQYGYGTGVESPVDLDYACM